MLRPAEYCSDNESDESDYGNMLAETINNRNSQIVYDDNGLNYELNATDYEYEQQSDPEQQLLDAIVDGNVKQFETLLENERFSGKNLNEPLINNQPPILILACLHANFELIRSILVREVNCNLEFDGVNALIAICTAERSTSFEKEQKHAAIVRRLIENGCDFNFKDKHLGTSVFLWAVRNGHLETIKYLLTVRGLDYCAVDNRQRNGLMVAIEEQQEHVFFYFMKRKLFEFPDQNEECLRKMLITYSNRGNDLHTKNDLLMQKISSALTISPNYGPLSVGLLKEIADLNLSSDNFLQLFKNHIQLWDLYEIPIQQFLMQNFDRKFCDLFAAHQFNNLMFPFFAIYQKQNQSYKKFEKYENVRMLPILAKQYRAQDYFATIKNLFRLIFVTNVQLNYFRDVFRKFFGRAKTRNCLLEIREQTLAIHNKLETLRNFSNYNKCFS